MQVLFVFGVKRDAGFYLVCFNYDDAQNMYVTNFEMKNLYDYSTDEINNMIPYERDIYIALIISDMKQKKENNQRK